MKTENIDIMQGPLITDGRNGFNWTGLYIGWSTILKFLTKIFEKYFQMNNFIERRSFRSKFLHQIVATP